MVSSSNILKNYVATVSCNCFTTFPTLNKATLTFLNKTVFFRALGEYGGGEYGGGEYGGGEPSSEQGVSGSEYGSVPPPGAAEEKPKPSITDLMRNPSKVVLCKVTRRYFISYSSYIPTYSLRWIQVH